MNYRNPILAKANFRRLVEVMSKHRLVKAVRQRGPKIRVIFTTGVRETWNRESGRILISHDPFSGGQVAVTHQYESDLLMDKSLDKMHMIDWKLWRHAGFFHKRLVIQELIALLQEEGYLKIKFPHTELLEELQLLWDVDIWRAHSAKNRLLVYGSYGSRLTPGRKLIEQFSNWGEVGDRTLKDSWTKPYALYSAICRLLLAKRDVTRHALMCEICHTYRCFRICQQFFCPSLYRAIFQRFEIKNQTVADPHQDFGSKAIASVMESNFYHSGTVNQPLAGFLGSPLGKLDREHYDVVLLDYGWRDPGSLLIEDLKKWAKKADMKIVYVPKYRVNQLPKPYMSMKVETKIPRRGEPDWLFCYA